MIINKPDAYPDDYRVNQLRAAEENRAKWFLYLYREGLERGLNADFAREAMAESGKFLSKDSYGDVRGVKAFLDRWMDEVREKAYESHAETAGSGASITCAYCPLVNAWAKLVPEEELPVLCDLAEEMLRTLCRERGIACRIDASIASGDGSCRFTLEENDGQE